MHHERIAASSSASVSTPGADAEPRLSPLVQTVQASILGDPAPRRSRKQIQHHRMPTGSVILLCCCTHLKCCLPSLAMPQGRRWTRRTRSMPAFPRGSHVSLIRPGARNFVESSNVQLATMELQASKRRYSSRPCPAMLPALSGLLAQGSPTAAQCRHLLTTVPQTR